MKNESYEHFVEKFKPKLTTDDCYTPPQVYEAVRRWAVKQYGIQGRKIVRPFYPGGDYEHFDYPENCVVIDNPPFSILSKIKRFYIDRRIDFFLFAPTLTLFSGDIHGVNYVEAACLIIYENGAIVSTSFTTNMGDAFIQTAPDLKKAVELVNKKSAVKITKYIYPDNVISGALLAKISKVPFTLFRDQCSAKINKLDSQAGTKKEIFGGGYLISDERAAELRAAEQATKFDLSDREIEIIKSLR